MVGDERKLEPYTGPGASSWVTGADAEREHIWSLTETYKDAHLEWQRVVSRSDLAHLVIPATAAVADAQRELRQALGFAVD